MLSNIRPTECLGTISACESVCVCVCGGGYTYSLIVRIYAYKCTVQSVCVSSVCAHMCWWQRMGVSCAPTCPLQQQSVWSLTPSLNTLTSPLCGYVWVCCLESNVLYVWVESRLFALSVLCLHRQHTHHSPDVTLCCPLSVFSRVYDALCKHGAILWLQNQLVHLD